jgi:crotonobetainyl-CoA:carnitine CoA-transferase CaiB-like acyl-CoA transferase
VDDPQLRARQYFQPIVHPDLDETVTFLGPFAQLSATPLQLRHLPPTLGEHNRAVYGDELGLSPEDLAILREQGVI